MANLLDSADSAGAPRRPVHHTCIQFHHAIFIRQPAIAHAMIVRVIFACLTDMKRGVQCVRPALQHGIRFGYRVVSRWTGHDNRLFRQRVLHRGLHSPLSARGFAHSASRNSSSHQRCTRQKLPASCWHPFGSRTSKIIRSSIQIMNPNPALAPERISPAKQFAAFAQPCSIRQFAGGKNPDVMILYPPN